MIFRGTDIFLHTCLYLAWVIGALSVVALLLAFVGLSLFLIVFAVDYILQKLKIGRAIFIGYHEWQKKRRAEDFPGA